MLAINKPLLPIGIDLELRTVHIDSLSAHALILNQKISAMNQPIDIKDHFLKAASETKILIWQDAKLADSTANVLTTLLDFRNTLQLSREMRLIRDYIFFYLTETYLRFVDVLVSVHFLFCFELIINFLYSN